MAEDVGNDVYHSFFFGPHTAFINEFPQRFNKFENGHGTKYNALQDFLNLQKKNNPTLILEDNELRDACAKQDERDFNDRIKHHEYGRNCANLQGHLNL